MLENITFKGEFDSDLYIATLLFSTPFPVSSSKNEIVTNNLIAFLGGSSMVASLSRIRRFT